MNPSSPNKKHLNKLANSSSLYLENLVTPLKGHVLVAVDRPLALFRRICPGSRPHVLHTQLLLGSVWVKIKVHFILTTEDFVAPG